MLHLSARVSNSAIPLTEEMLVIHSADQNSITRGTNGIARHGTGPVTRLGRNREGGRKGLEHKSTIKHQNNAVCARKHTDVNEPFCFILF